MLGFEQLVEARAFVLFDQAQAHFFEEPAFLRQVSRNLIEQVD